DATLGTGDIWFTSSFDGGLTWTLPVKVNCDPPGAEQWAPKMTMDQSTGEILIVYNDQRNGPALGAEQWASISRDCGVTWTDFLISDKGSVPAISSFIGPPGPVGAAWIGDYLGADMSFALVTPYGFTFNDGRNGADQDVQFESTLDIDADCDGWPASIDCDDTNPLVNPGATEVLCDGLDNDCNPFTADDVDADGDGVSVCAGDCDDNDPNNFPGNIEICDGADNDCDGIVDNGFDLDGDGWTTCAGDCNDANATVFPGATEVLCDGLDNDCDPSTPDDTDADGDGVSLCAGDCDDNNATVFPGAAEICDGLDNDCNTLVDDGLAFTTYYADSDGDGFGDAGTSVTTCSGPPPGYVTDNTDCDDSDASVNPAATEICDGLDNDCDGFVDEGFDLDGDGWTTCAGDCNDAVASINPGAPEICGNGIDDDCDGLTDAADPDCSSVVHPGAFGLDQNNASVALSETIGGHVYVSFNEFAGPGPGPVPTAVGHAWSSGGGAPGTWSYLGLLPPGPSGLPESWNATITGHHLGGFYMSSVAYGLPPYGGPSVIQLSGTPGGGAPFVFTGPGIGIGVPGFSWVDFPYLVMQEDPAVPPPDVGTGHIAWVEYIDGDGDPNGDLNAMNDPGDVFQIWYSFSNTIVGPFIWPLASPPMLLQPPLPVVPLSHQTHRPAVAVVNTKSAVHYPAGAVYVAWTDGFSIYLDVNPAPVVGAPWGGPVPVLGVGAFLPPIIAPGITINASTSVTLALDDGPNCPGNVYLAWSDMAAGDADIWFSSSADGGSTWSAPTQVNCDPAGVGAYQWAPQMRVDPVSGDICIVFYDSRTAPAAGVETWAAVSTDCGLSWSNHLVSLAGPVAPFNLLPNPPGPAGGSFAGDYLGVDINALNRAGIAWNDGRNGADEDVFFQSTKQATACRTGCCVVPGDFNHDGSFNIADVTAGIGYIFSGGPPPPCCEEADFDGSGSFNIADVTAGIAFIFSGGPPAVCGPPGMSCNAH
ncbi:MAG TPA: MopE-related protein, partial [candidate division Zixibacteria bacterium]|nr:MopE-related protein [candidate division Zixibacteria bacterium]